VVCYGFPEHKHGENADFFSAVGERNLNILKRILDSATDTEADSVVSTLLTTRSSSYDEYNFDMLKTGYQACMDTDTIAAAGVKPLQRLISSLNEIWPLQPGDLNATLSSASDYDSLHQAVVFFEQFGVKTITSQCFEDTIVMPDILDSKVSRVCFSMPDPVPTNYSMYADESALQQYATGVAQALYLAYEDLDEAGATALAESVVTFESDLLQLAIPILQEVEADGDYWVCVTVITIVLVVEKTVTG
jgi:endothelin-converting enzyme